MVGFVHHYQIVVGIAGQKRGGVAAEPRVGNDDHWRIPRRLRGRLHFAVGMLQGHSAAGTLQDGDAEVELAPQFLLPLAAGRFGGQDQQPLQPPLVEAGFQQDAGLQGFAQPHFVGNQQAVLVGLGDAPAAKVFLMRPELGADGSGGGGRVSGQGVINAPPQFIPLRRQVRRRFRLRGRRRRLRGGRRQGRVMGRGYLLQVFGIVLGNGDDYHRIAAGVP